MPWVVRPWLKEMPLRQPGNDTAGYRSVLPPRCLCSIVTGFHSVASVNISIKGTRVIGAANVFGPVTDSERAKVNGSWCLSEAGMRTRISV